VILFSKRATTATQCLMRAKTIIRFDEKNTGNRSLVSRVNTKELFAPIRQRTTVPMSSHTAQVYADNSTWWWCILLARVEKRV
jgi:hypothetical protein